MIIRSSLWFLRIFCSIENLPQPLLELIDIVVDQVLLVELLLIDQAYQCKALINLSKVQNDLFITSTCMIKLDD